MRRTICAAAVLLLAAPTYADDSSAALGAGGIVFTQGTPIRMAAEDLTVSPQAVRVRFQFVNDTAKDVTTLVAFPLPDIDMGEFWGSPLGTVTADPVNFLGFKASVDGKPVALKMEQRAFYKGRDVTAEIASAGLPVNLAAGNGYQILDRLCAYRHGLLVKEGLLAADGTNYIPQWTVRTKFYWQQTFPAHRTVTIEHSYQPVTGQSFFVTEELADKYYDKTYCLDPPTKARIADMIGAAKARNPDSGGYITAYATDYVLKTANNWKGPIGRFHLTLDKLKPGNTLSLCWPGTLNKTGPATFESTLTDFSPAADIRLLVLE